MFSIRSPDFDGLTYTPMTLQHYTLLQNEKSNEIDANKHRISSRYRIFLVLLIAGCIFLAALFIGFVIGSSSLHNDSAIQGTSSKILT